MINGVINIYKEKGYTSHDVVAKLRGILKQKKIGHTGTLDPDAQGVLPVCLGKATKLCDMLTDKSKTYEAELTLGIETDTQDISGTILKQREVLVGNEEVIACVQGFVGEKMQIPPMYSALKVNGKKLYELAREGIEVERKARKVTFYDISILSIELPIVKIRVHCSKGTYIRTLCHDIGQQLGCGACMSSLIRTQVDRFVLKDSLRLDEVAQLVASDAVLSYIIPVEEMFHTYCKVHVKQPFDKLIYNGNSFLDAHIEPLERVFQKNEMVRVYDSAGTFVGIYAYEEQAFRFKPVKMFYEA